MKASLVERPAISHSASPAKMLSQTGAWRRMELLSTDFDLKCTSRHITLSPSP